MPGPLEGFRVIDICRAGPGQWATGLLADYGADVITIVEPGHAQRRAGGGAVAPESVAINRRNKRSMFLDLRAEGAVDLFLRLAKDSDAVLESNRPGAVKRLGIDYESLRSVNPSIVYCSLSGFGQHGPYARIAAHDLTYQGVGGMVPQNEDGTPRMPAYNQADINAATSGAMAILMALLRRSKTGEGQYIDVAFADVAVTVPPGRMADEGLRGHYPAYQIFETKDGRYLTLSTREPWFWERTCKMIGREDWIGEIRPQGPLNEEMFAYFHDLFKTRTLEEWMPLLAEHDLQYGPVNRTLEELSEDPHIKARKMLLQVTSPTTGSTALEPGFAYKFSQTPASLRWGPQALGADTDDILADLGFAPPDIVKMRESGVTGHA